MNVEIAISKFKFSIFAILFYLLLIILLISLGYWQLGRAEEKRLILENQAQSAARQLVDLKSVIDLDLEQLRYREVQVSGHYDQAHQYLIDNQILNGQAGYFVMTPFKLDNSNHVVLINRGWVALNKDRRILPELSVNNEQAVITGRINHFPVVGIRLKGAEIPTESWPSVVQVVDSEILSKKLGYSIMPFQIELAVEMSDGYTRDWRTNTIMPPEKHVAYAVQWFGLAVTLTVLFLWFSSKKE